MNVIILSMARCGVSWVGNTLSLIHEAYYGKPLDIDYEFSPRLLSTRLVKGWH